MADVRLRRAYIELNAKVGKYQTALKRVQRRNQQLGKNLKGLQGRVRNVNKTFNNTSKSLGSLKTAFTGLIAALSVNKITGIIKESTEYNATLSRSAEALRLTTEELDNVRLAFARVGTDTRDTDDILRTILENFKEARDGIKSYADGFLELGFTVEDFNRRGISVLEILERITQGMQKFDAVAQHGLIGSILGDEGLRAIPVFIDDKLVENIREATKGAEDQTHKLRALDVAITEVSWSYATLRNAIVTAISPEIISLVERLKVEIESVDIDKLSEDVRELGEGLEPIAELSVAATKGLGELAGQLNESFGASNLINIGLLLIGLRGVGRSAKSAYSDIGSGARNATKQLAKVKTGTDQFRQSLKGVRSIAGLIVPALAAIPKVGIPLSVAAYAALNLADNMSVVNQEALKYLEYSERLDELVNRPIETLDQAKRKLEDLKAEAERITVRRPPAEITDLVGTLEKLGKAYTEAESALKKFQSQSEIPVAQLPKLPEFQFDVIETLKVRVDPVIETQKILDLQRELSSVPILLNIETDFEYPRSEIQDFLNQLDSSKRLRDELESKRIDLQLANGEITLEQYRELKTLLEAIQQLNAEGVYDLDGENVGLLERRIELLERIARIETKIGNVEKDATNEAERRNKVARRAEMIAQRFSETIADVVVEGRSLRDVFSGVAKEIAKAAINAAIIGPLTGFLSKTFGGLLGKHQGGPVGAGVSYIVGERGPEIFTPRSAGEITPNHELGGSKTTIQITINTLDANGVQGAIDRAKPEIIEIATAAANANAQRMIAREVG